MNAVLLTQVEYAEHRGVGRSAVSNWKRNKLLVFAEGPDGLPLVDRDRTDARLHANINPMRGRRRAKEASEAVAPALGSQVAPGPSIGDARSDLLREQVTRERLRNAKDAGELVPLAEYERRAAELGRQTRERVQSALANVAERLAVETDPRKLTLLMSDAVDRVFSEIADLAAGGVERPSVLEEGVGGEVEGDSGEEA